VHLLAKIKTMLLRDQRIRNADIVRIEGPIERSGDRWLLRIPLSVGGAQLASCTRGIGEVKGDIHGEGCADTARRGAGRTHFLPTGPGRIASPVCPDLIYDTHNGRLVAFAGFVARIMEEKEVRTSAIQPPRRQSR
jgi:hypothetical protein